MKCFNRNFKNPWIKRIRLIILKKSSIISAESCHYCATMSSEYWEWFKILLYRQGTNTANIARYRFRDLHGPKHGHHGSLRRHRAGARTRRPPGFQNPESFRGLQHFRNYSARIFQCFRLHEQWELVGLGSNHCTPYSLRTEGLRATRGRAFARSDARQGPLAGYAFGCPLARPFRCWYVVVASRERHCGPST